MDYWSKTWLIKFNLEKCHILTFGKPKSFAYRLWNHILQMEKDLGVLVDSNLSFENHMATKISKANQIVGLIRRSFAFLDAGPTYFNGSSGADTGFIFTTAWVQNFFRESDSPIPRWISWFSPRFFQICFQVYSEMKLIKIRFRSGYRIFPSMSKILVRTLVDGGVFIKGRWADLVIFFSELNIKNETMIHSFYHFDITFLNGFWQTNSKKQIKSISIKSEKCLNIQKSVRITKKLLIYSQLFNFIVTEEKAKLEKIFTKLKIIVKMSWNLVYKLFSLKKITA